MANRYNLFLKGVVGSWSYSADMINYVLDQNAEKQVDVLVCSTGGYTDEALQIAALFKIHGNVNAHLIGVNASASTIATMGCKRISMDADALFLIHKCSNLICQCDYFNADELEKHIQDLQKTKKNQEALDCAVAGLYASRCKKSKEELLALMAEDTFLSAAEALEWGFIDEITDKQEDKVDDIKASLSALRNAGVAVPDRLCQKSSIEKWLSKICSIISKKTDCAPPNNQNMKKLPLTEIAVGREISPDKPLSNADLDAIEKAFSNAAENEKKINSLLAELESLKKSVADLSAEPAQISKSVVSNGANADPCAPSGNLREDVNFLSSLC